MEVFLNSNRLKQNEIVSYNEAQGALDIEIKNQYLTTLIMKDVSLKQPYIHAIIENIKYGEISKGHIVLSYIPPLPANDIHSYVISVYKQNSILNNYTNNRFLNLNDYIFKNDLSLVIPEFQFNVKSIPNRNKESIIPSIISPILTSPSSPVFKES